MRLADPDSLEGIGLGLYERKALMALMLCGVADAATLCREGDVPTSKIYQAMEKLAGLGLVQIQQTRPRMFAALVLISLSGIAIYIFTTVIARLSLRRWHESAVRRES